MIERYPIVGREEWLKWRNRDVTASAAAALLDVHPYITKLQLWLEKSDPANSLPSVETPPMRRGRLLESVALEVIREQYPEWKVEPANVYLRDPDRRFGATPDCFVHNEHGFGIVEVKSIEASVFERSWRDVDGSISPPLSAALQGITCKRLAGASWCSVAALRVGHGVELDLIPIPEPDGLWQRLLDAVSAFWQSIEEGLPPEPVFPADVETVLKLHRASDPGFTVDLSGNNRVLWMRDHDAELAAREKSACEERRALRAELAALMGPAEVALYEGRPIVTAKSVTRKAYSVPESVYRDIRWKRTAP